MGRNVVRLGDPTTHGGRVISVSSKTNIEGKLVALLGDLVSCPLPGHGVNPIIEASTYTFSDGKPVVMDQCACACGCKVIATTTTSEID
ncbi:MULTISPECIES: PAAR domain-containing protein [unclassified Gilliamella]|uniref:PAAR domain-containing protein n=1 Tax=unclassified Gilliamella TaxID=2685620 RepID=UPI001C6A502E|nr:MULTISPECIES: PAAR domain-containing protein [unclassified Gilliamella]MCX8601086.1 PAAR domain-containing protein [Gilliamella sp. B3722]MCX8607240.1 PAAR domain-containing protein [Gilliamella sp. B3771]MCX8610571.1 PAAR domain-containing protein [Gilliamella sp. B3891]MCX8612760.1 PAAR domain-containing protein [Gilliamella sp. B3773]MCX8614669.1 PAAR domain-containing protein [Gilliamella sp. B3770]